MAFYGRSFTFDGVACEEFGLTMYSIGDNNAGDAAFASAKVPVEQELPNRHKPIFLGTKYDKRLTFDIVFGATPDRIDSRAFIDRYDMEAVSTWLTGHEDYKWLTIQQNDMSDVRYRCMVTELTPISFDMMPVAFRATFTCDGAYAYHEEKKFTYACSGETRIQILNDGGMNGYYKPLILFQPSGGTALKIKNISDNGREFTVTDIPSGVNTISIDCENCILDSNTSANLYANCNFLFPRLRRGMNELLITAEGTVTFICSFPAGVGA